jgi:pyridoxal phosphate enzyme (YggS family)
MKFVHNFKIIRNEIQTHLNKVSLIVVSKNQTVEKINYLISEGHKDFGENRVQEAKSKWSDILKKNTNLKLHFIGKLQSNKIKGIGELFEFIHSLDNIKNAQLLANEETRTSKKLKYFIQVNLTKEVQKSGIEVEKLSDFIIFCRKINLNIIGLMYIPPLNADSPSLFKKLKILSSHYSLNELSMGMSNDYKDAIANGATYVRIGSLIFNSD